MRNIGGLALAALLGTVHPAWAGSPSPASTGFEQVLTMRVDGTISVDATGKVNAYELTTKLEPAVKAVIDKAVPHWSFLPPEVDGKVRAVKTSMRITLLGRQVADGYQVSIDNVLFSKPTYDDFFDGSGPGPAPGPSAGSMTIASMEPLPKFPKFRISGMVTLQLSVSPEGRVLEASPTQCSLYHANGALAELARICREMERNVAKAARQWTFRHEGGPAMPTTTTLPFLFYSGGEIHEIITKASAPGAWRLEARTPYRVPAWAQKDRFDQRVGTSDSVGGELTSSASPLRWRGGTMGGVL